MIIPVTTAPEVVVSNVVAFISPVTLPVTLPTKVVAVTTPALPNWIAVPTWISLSASMDGYAVLNTDLAENVETPATIVSSKLVNPSISTPPVEISKPRAVTIPALPSWMEASTWTSSLASIAGYGVKVDTPADESIQRIKHLAGI